MRKFGLIGKNIDYSFSKDFFSEKFKTENIKDVIYENFDLENITDFPLVLKNNPTLNGLNVTIPYKELIIPYLNKIDKKAKKIGAVNTIRITKKGNLKGYNTDYIGFKESLIPLLKSHHKSAIILGAGGASKAVAYVLKKMKIDYKFVTRNSTKTSTITYDSITYNDVKNHSIIINCTPLGTTPDVESYPNIPYEAITENHLLFDLIYNPEETVFLKKGKAKNAITINGLNMLKIQANESWHIWNR